MTLGRIESICSIRVIEAGVDGGDLYQFGGLTGLAEPVRFTVFASRFEMRIKLSAAGDAGYAHCAGPVVRIVVNADPVIGAVGVSVAEPFLAVNDNKWFAGATEIESFAGMNPVLEPMPACSGRADIRPSPTESKKDGALGTVACGDGPVRRAIHVFEPGVLEVALEASELGAPGLGTNVLHQREPEWTGSIGGATASVEIALPQLNNVVLKSCIGMLDNSFSGAWTIPVEDNLVAATRDGIANLAIDDLGIALIHRIAVVKRASPPDLKMANDFGARIRREKSRERHRGDVGSRRHSHDSVDVWSGWT